VSTKPNTKDRTGSGQSEPILIELDSQVASSVQRPAASPAKPQDVIPELSPSLSHYGLPVHVFTYRDAAGLPIAAVCRYEVAGGKQFRQFTLRRRADDGRLFWDPHAPDAPRPLYGLDLLAARPEASVFFCEGEKAADSTNQMIHEAVCVTTSGGAGSPHKSDLSPLRGRKVIIWPDADEAGAKYAAKVRQLLEGADETTQVVTMSPITVKPGFDVDGLPTFGPGFIAPQGWDAADAYAEGWTDAHVNKLLHTEGALQQSSSANVVAVPTPTFRRQTPNMDICPAGFVQRPDGLYFTKQTRNGEELVWLSSWIRVVALARSVESTGWCTVLEFENIGGVTHSWTFPNTMHAGELQQICATLLSLGARVTTNVYDRPQISRYIQDCKPAERKLCVSRPGWNENGEVNGKCFVLPDGTVFGEANQLVVIETRDPTAGDAFKATGSLADWKEGVGSLCEGNSRMILSVCAALAGPVLTPLGQESGGFHFRGPSSTGKTTTLAVATSVWGDPKSLTKNWRATANGLEAMAAQTNDLMLALDEMSQVEPKEAGATAYMLGNGKGKARANQHGGGKAIAEWTLVFLSTGEGSLAGHLQSGGIRVKAGQEARCIDVAADAGAGLGLFEVLNGETGGAELSMRLKRAAAANNGTAGRAFIEVLADPARRDAVLNGIKEDIDAFERQYVPADAASQVGRVAHRFAIVAAVGEACIRLGILPWQQGQAVWGANLCFASWMAERGGSANLEGDQAISQVRHHHATFGSANYQLLIGGAPDERYPFHGQRYGFRRTANDGSMEYLIPSESFQRIVCAGLDYKAVIVTLKAAGYLLSDSNEKNQWQVRVDGVRQRFYVIGATLFADADEEPVPPSPTPSRPRVSALASKFTV
jgi:putative DNA primase/helicase